MMDETVTKEIKEEGWQIENAPKESWRHNRAIKQWSGCRHIFGL